MKTSFGLPAARSVAAASLLLLLGCGGPGAGGGTGGAGEGGEEGGAQGGGGGSARTGGAGGPGVPEVRRRPAAPRAAARAAPVARRPARRQRRGQYSGRRCWHRRPRGPGRRRWPARRHPARRPRPLDRQRQRAALDQPAGRPQARAGADVRQPRLRRQPLQRGDELAVSAFSALKNPPGTGNAATYDGTPARATFYTPRPTRRPPAAGRRPTTPASRPANHTVHHYHGALRDSGMNFKPGRLDEGDPGLHRLPRRRRRRHEARGPRRLPHALPPVQRGPLPGAEDLGFQYDCSIEEGHQDDQDGTNYLWPYTLDSGSPGNATHPNLTPIKTWPAGVWEMPAYRVIVPPDAEAQKYGVPSGLRAKLMHRARPGVAIGAGKITGLDYNLWYDYKLNKAEFVATRSTPLDQPARGNRAPMLFGMHSAIYAGRRRAAGAGLAGRSQGGDRRVPQLRAHPPGRPHRHDEGGPRLDPQPGAAAVTGGPRQRRGRAPPASAPSWRRRGRDRRCTARRSRRGRAARCWSPDRGR